MKSYSTKLERHLTSEMIEKVAEPLRIFSEKNGLIENSELHQIYEDLLNVTMENQFYVYDLHFEVTKLNMLIERINNTFIGKILLKRLGA